MDRRRSGLWLVAAISFAGALAGCGRDAPPPQPGTLNVLMPSGSIDPAIPRQFERVTGEKVVIDFYDDAEAMRAALGPSDGVQRYDLLIAHDREVPALIERGRVQPLDRAALSNGDHVMERFREPAYDAGGRHSLPYQWGTVGVLFRTDRLPDGFDRSWALIYEADRQPGPFILIDDMRACFASALKHRGESVNTTDAAAIRRAGEAIRAATASERCLGFEGPISTGDGGGESGGAVLAIVRSDDAGRAMATDAGLGYFLPEEGSAMWVDVMLLPAGAQDDDLALRFIDYLLDPQIGAQLANWARRPTPNRAALRYVEPEQRADPAIYPPDEVMGRLEPLEPVGEATALYEALWAAIRDE